MTPQPNDGPIDIFAERDRRSQEGMLRWNELTKSWSEADRKWAWEFIANSSQAWG